MDDNGDPWGVRISVYEAHFPMSGADPTCCVPAHGLVPDRFPSRAPVPNPSMIRDLAERSPDHAAILVVLAVLA